MVKVSLVGGEEIKALNQTELLRLNLQRAFGFRCGIIDVYFPNMSHGVAIRHVRVSGMKVLMIQISRSGFLESSVIMIYEDIDHARANGLIPLVKMWKEQGIAADARIVITRQDLKIRKLKCIDGMHRKGASDRCAAIWTLENPNADPDDNPYHWARTGWLFDAEGLQHLKIVLAQEANRATSSFVASTYCDYMCGMTKNIDYYMDYVFKFLPERTKNGKKKKFSVTGFSEWYFETIDNSVTAATIRVLASVALRLKGKALDYVVGMFMDEDVTLSHSLLACCLCAMFGCTRCFIFLFIFTQTHAHWLVVHYTGYQRVSMSLRTF